MCQLRPGFLETCAAEATRTGKPVPSRPGLHPSLPPACTRPRHASSHGPCHAGQQFKWTAPSHLPSPQWTPHHEHMSRIMALSWMECHVDHHPHPSMGGNPIALGDCAQHRSFQTSIQPRRLILCNLLLQHTLQISSTMECVARSEAIASTLWRSVAGKITSPTILLIAPLLLCF